MRAAGGIILLAVTVLAGIACWYQLTDWLTTRRRRTARQAPTTTDTTPGCGTVTRWREAG